MGLADWLREARDDIFLQKTISKDVAEWQQRNKPGDRLYRGSQLKEAQAWARRNTPSEDEVAFLRASVASRVRFLASLIAIVLIVVSSMGGASWILTHQSPKPADPTHVINLQDDGVGSLRWAIANAPAGSTISFDARLRGTILLSSDNLDIAKNLKILGPGADKLSINDGASGYNVRVLQGASVTISGLTLTGTGSSASDDALLSNDGTLILTNSLVSGNVTIVYSGRGIYNDGTLTLTNSIVSGNVSRGTGGGIYNDGTLTLTNSTVSGNTATGSYVGGGVYNDQGTLILSNSTVSGNTAFNGGGIYNFYGTLTLTNSTISDNKAYRYGGGGILIQSFVDKSGKVVGASGNVYITQVDLTFCTIYGNTAHHGGDIAIEDVAFDSNSNRTAIKQISQVKVRNSIIAADSTHPGPDIEGTLISGGYNLIQDNSGATFLDPNGLHTWDRMVKPLSDLKIDSHLSNNDKPTQTLTNGGHTQTLKLQRGSPAIDYIPPAACHVTVQDASGKNMAITSDQLNDPRPDGSRNDPNRMSLRTIVILVPTNRHIKASFWSPRPFFLAEWQTSHE